MTRHVISFPVLNAADPLLKKGAADSIRQADPRQPNRRNIDPNEGAGEGPWDRRGALGTSWEDHGGPVGALRTSWGPLGALGASLVVPCGLPGRPGEQISLI